MNIILRTHAVKLIPLRFAAAAVAAATLATAIPAVPAFAQDSTADARIRKIEAEVRALQRKVFPGGDGRFFEPQIGGGDSAGPNVPISAASSPSSAAATDILVRLNTLESQLRALTGRSEEQANALSQMELRLAALETATNVPLASTAVLPPAVLPGPAAPAPIPAAATASVSAPSAARLAAVQAITKPQTADAGDDEYSFGFRLWNAGFYPEARQQLTRFVEQYPNHARISFGRNLLGRAFLDDNLAEEAARWFLKNYQANKAGDRAPDSLLYLGKAMIALGDTRKACIALAEFGETYSLVATGRLADEYKASLAKVKCS